MIFINRRWNLFQNNMGFNLNTNLQYSTPLVGRCAPDQWRNCKQSGGRFGASAYQPPLERKNQMNAQDHHLISDQFRH